jgi:predicted transcriptional regulator
MNLDQLQQDKITKQLSILYAVNIWTAKGEQITNKLQTKGKQITNKRRTNYKQRANKLQTNDKCYVV